MKALEIETMELGCQLACHSETEEKANRPAVWGDSTLTTSAVWGGRMAEWESSVTSKKSPLLHTTAVRDEATQ